MRSILFLAALPIALLVPAPATAACDDGDIVAGTVTFGVAPNIYHLHAQGARVELYQETNGVEGLQRGGSSILPEDTEDCGYPGPEGPDARLV